MSRRVSVETHGSPDNKRQSTTAALPGSHEAQAQQALRELVRQMAGRRLPSERDMAAHLSISRPRLRSLLASLQAEGLVQSLQGSGTYALDPEREGNLRRVVLLIDSSLKLGDDPFFSLLLDRLQSALQGEGIRCLVERADAGSSSSSFPPLEDGAITLGLAGSILIARQRPSDPPVVGLLLGPEVRPNRRASVFQLEDREASEEAARHLLEKGCRNIYFVGRHDIAASRERLAGAQAAISAAGQELASLHVVDCPLNYGGGLALGREIDLPPSAGSIGIIAANDWLAVGLRSGLQHRRNRPDFGSIPIVSFDGLPVAADPALHIRSMVVPIDSIASDTVAELGRLHRATGPAGRIVRYPLSWTS